MDCLTIIRAHIAAGKPHLGQGRTASFEVWDDLVRQPVVWLAQVAVGRADVPTFGDPLDVVQRQFDDDPETQKLAAFLSAWHAKYGSTPATVSMATKADDEALHDALSEIAAQGSGINSRMLGRWLERNRGRRHRGMFIERGKMLRGFQTWLVKTTVPPMTRENNAPEPTTSTTAVAACSPRVGVVSDGGFSSPTEFRDFTEEDEEFLM